MTLILMQASSMSLAWSVAIATDINSGAGSMPFHWLDLTNQDGPQIIHTSGASSLSFQHMFFQQYCLGVNLPYHKRFEITNLQ